MGTSVTLTYDEHDRCTIEGTDTLLSCAYTDAQLDIINNEEGTLLAKIIVYGIVGIVFYTILCICCCSCLKKATKREESKQRQRVQAAMGQYVTQMPQNNMGGMVVGGGARHMGQAQMQVVMQPQYVQVVAQPRQFNYA
ncbi:hypothetical protein KIPB_003726 [Kipferlia bialata]|nr:hypothetical protein KIPB_003726 [Kipferlia bialata]|eukprot:g3726.t1